MRIGKSAPLLVLCLTWVSSAPAIDCREYPTAYVPSSPIVINLDDGPYRLTGAESPVTFDFYASGQMVRMGWTAADAAAAFLCLDRDASGSIENGTELFGNVTPLNDGTRARNGFDVLVELDTNRDLIIDDQDPIWSELVLWTDANHDAISQFDELMPIAESRVAAIGLDYHWNGRVDPSGNALRYQSKVWIGTGNERPTPRPVYDVFFVPVI